MRIVLFTIVLDGMPWITHHLPAFNRLKIDWHWHVVEGVSAPRHCTSGCKELPARFSVDGTSQYLSDIDHHPRVTVLRKQKWDGKVEMVNVPMTTITEECILMQIDSDELWQAWQIEHLVRMFERTPLVKTAQFTCRYFVGHDIAPGGGSRHATSRTAAPNWLPTPRAARSRPPTRRSTGFARPCSTV